MPQVVATSERVHVPADLQEKALLGGDLSKLTVAERLSFYNSICSSLGLNPLTRPFEYIQLNGKLTLYARKDCTEQLRTNRRVSITKLQREVVEGVYVVTASAEEQLTQRTDESIGAVPIANLQGEAKANAMMKAETKAKRRVTLSICGLGMLDETEIETIPGAKVVEGTLRDLGPIGPAINQAAHQAPSSQPIEAGATESPSSTPPVGGDSLIIWNLNGKHKGKNVRELPDNYLDWYVREGTNQAFVDVAREELDRRAAAEVFAGETSAD